LLAEENRHPRLIQMLPGCHDMSEIQRLIAFIADLDSSRKSTIGGG
jgi:hypothetical protein